MQHTTREGAPIGGSRATLRRLARLALAGATAVATAFAIAAPAAAHDHRTAKPGVVRDGDTWLLNDSTEDGYADHRYTYGADDHIHIMGDWDGDGDRTPGVIRIGGSVDGDQTAPLVWYLSNDNETGVADIRLEFGEAYSRESWETPIVGDWDGDGDETVGVVHAHHDVEGMNDNTFEWKLRNENSTGEPDTTFLFGAPQSYGQFDPQQQRGVPVVGDWDGNGTTTPGVVQLDPEDDTAWWRLRNENSTGTEAVEFHYGVASDRPVTGDWDGDGDVNPGIIRAGNHWFLRHDNSEGYADQDFEYGLVEDEPVVWR